LKKTDWKKRHTGKRSHQIWLFYAFRFRVRISWGTDGRTDRRPRRVMRPIWTVARYRC